MYALQLPFIQGRLFTFSCIYPVQTNYNWLKAGNHFSFVSHYMYGLFTSASSEVNTLKPFEDCRNILVLQSTSASLDGMPTYHQSGLILVLNMAQPCPLLRVGVVFTVSAGSDTIHIELTTTYSEIKSRGSIFQNKNKNWTTHFTINSYIKILKITT